MIVIQVTWKAEWVGGLTLETHPASNTTRCCASLRQRSVRLNSMLSQSTPTVWNVASPSLTWGQGRGDVYLCLSPAASPFFSSSSCPDGKKRKHPTETWVWLRGWNDWTAINLPSGLEIISRFLAAADAPSSSGLPQTGQLILWLTISRSLAKIMGQCSCCFMCLLLRPPERTGGFLFVNICLQPWTEMCILWKSEVSHVSHEYITSIQRVQSEGRKVQNAGKMKKIKTKKILCMTKLSVNTFMHRPLTRKPEILQKSAFYRFLDQFTNRNLFFF